MTPAAPQYGDSELQTDVMRFMAIIAFCLIAILALVRNVTPEATARETTVTQTAAVPEPVPATKPIPLPIPEAPKRIVAAAPEVPEPAPAARQPEAAPPSGEAIAAREPVATAKPAPAPAAAKKPPAPAEPAPTEQGLILRFASDGDFLRLIARGDIRVYAYQDGDVLTLSESYQFLDTQAPGQIYELLQGSIPSLVVDALRRARPEVNGYRWGVVLPGRISHQIETYVSSVESGQLVIDRFGDVHHVAAS